MPKAPKPKELPEVIDAVDACYATRELVNNAILAITVLDPRHFALRAAIVAYSAVAEAVAALEDGDLVS